MPPRKPKPKRKPPVSLSDEQLLALLDRAKQHRYRDYVMILTTYWHGFRASETCALRESDYDLAAGTVRFKRGKGSEPGEHELQDFPDNPLLDERAVLTWWLGNRAQFGVKGGAKRQSLAIAKVGAPKMQQSTEIVTFSSPASRPCPERVSSGLASSTSMCQRAGGTEGSEPTTIHFLPSNEGPSSVGTVSPTTGEHKGNAGYCTPPQERGILPTDSQNPAGAPEPLPCPSKAASGQPDRSAGHPGGDLARSQEPGARSCSRLFPIGRVQFWRLVHGYAMAAGIPRRKCKTHMLKHTIAKHLVRAGHPLNEIQEWMGWSTIETMNWYTRADEEELGHRIGDTIRAKAGLRQVQQGSLFP